MKLFLVYFTIKIQSTITHKFFYNEHFTCFSAYSLSRSEVSRSFATWRSPSLFYVQLRLAVACERPSPSPTISQQRLVPRLVSFISVQECLPFIRHLALAFTFLIKKQGGGSLLSDFGTFRLFL